MTYNGALDSLAELKREVRREIKRSKYIWKWYNYNILTEFPHLLSLSPTLSAHNHWFLVGKEVLILLHLSVQILLKGWSHLRFLIVEGKCCFWFEWRYCRWKGKDEGSLRWWVPFSVLIVYFFCSQQWVYIINYS